jgi:hypothetical protein
MGAKGPTKKDLPPQLPTKIKGGRTGWTSNDNITLVRAAKPKVSSKDLPPKAPEKVKGGRTGWTTNDNITLLRALGYGR